LTVGRTPKAAKTLTEPYHNEINCDLITIREKPKKNKGMPIMSRTRRGKDVKNHPAYDPGD